MKKNNNKYFYFFLFGFIFIIFLLNYYHINQQGTYNNIFKPIADNLINGRDYTCSFFHNETLFYPIWGYTFLVFIDSLMGLSNLFVLGVQLILCYLSILSFYKIINIDKKYWHIPLFLPFIALMSVKWPDAIVGSLIIFFTFFILRYIENKKTKYLFLSGIILGILVNFRSEYLYLPFTLILLFFIPTFKRKKSLIIKSIFLLIIFSILFLLPWAFRSYSETGNFRLTASNGGAVSFISLGQLPNNPWNISPYDKTAYDLAKKQGFDNPYSIDADDMFRKKFINSIKQHPFAYSKKIAHNFFSIFYRGVYTGEYANYFIGIEKRMKIDSNITAQNGIFNKISYILRLKPTESLSLVFEKSIQALFILILFLMFLIIIYSIWTKTYKKFQNVFWVIIPVILYKFSIVSLIQYEYRHINAIYLLIFALCLLSLKNIKAKR